MTTRRPRCIRQPSRVCTSNCHLGARYCNRTGGYIWSSEVNIPTPATPVTPKPTPPAPKPKVSILQSMGPTPIIQEVASCCGVLSLSPFTFRGDTYSDYNTYKLSYGETYDPEQVKWYVGEKIKEKKPAAKLMMVILNKQENTKIGQTFLDLGFTLVSDMSNVRNPNTDNLLYTYIYDLNPS